MAESLKDLGTMLDDLNPVFQQVGHKMNMEKIKNMVNTHVVLISLSVGASTLEIVDEAR